MEQLTTVIISVISAGITSLITYYFTIRSNQVKQRDEIRKEQKYQYFFPLKNSATEFLHRLKHIEIKMVDDKDNIQAHLKQSFDGKKMKWFHSNSGKDIITNPGGYFLTSTIYMHCLLYAKIKLLQNEYPYMSVKLNRNLKDIVADNSEPQLQRCFEKVEEIKAEHHNLWKQVELVQNSGKKIQLRELITAIRTSTIMNTGIPYSLRLSYGDYVMKDNQEINYDEFCKILEGSKDRLKFRALIQFWTSVFDKNGEEDIQKLNRIRALILMLTLLDEAELE